MLQHEQTLKCYAKWKKLFIKKPQIFMIPLIWHAQNRQIYRDWKTHGFQFYKFGFTNQINNRKTIQILKYAKYLNSHFKNKIIHIVNKHMKRFSTSLVSREMQIKIMMRCYSIFKRLKTLYIRVWWGCGPTGTLIHWECSMLQMIGK